MQIVPNPYHWNRIDLDVFYGRNQLVSEIIADLKRGHSHAIVGGRKMGKTTLLRKIEHDIKKDLQVSLKTGSLMLPIYVDTLKLSRPLTAKTLYIDIVEQVEEYLKTINFLRSSYPSAISIFEEFPQEENRAFARILKGFIEEVQEYGFFRIGILIDEIEPITNTEWADGFFSNWRHLLSNEPELSSYISIVLAGAKEMIHIARDIGSPLANILTWRELSLFSRQDTENLVHTPTQNSLSDSISRKVFNLTGGHPFLIQYLMHHVCEYDLDEVEKRVKEARREFHDKQDTHFRYWWFEKLNDDERRCYAYLAESRKFVPKRDIIALLGDVCANNALRVLCHTGIARQGRKRECYTVAGTMFKEWFQKHGIYSVGSGVFDKDIYEKLKRLSSDIADKYVSAWSIYTVELPNYSGAVSELRDVVTLVLHKLAPDDEVKFQPDYKPEFDNNKNPLKNPTRKQRTRFIMKNRGKKTEHAKAIEAEIALLDALIDQLSRVVASGYSRASAQTHTVATREQAWRCLKQLDSILAQIL